MSINQPIRLVLADDHQIFRDGLQLLLKKNTAIKVIGEAENGEKLIALVKQLSPDMIITDLRMPYADGVTAIKEIRGFNTTVPIIVLSTYDNDDMIVDALEAGAIGYIVKDASRLEILDAITTVNNGYPYYCKSTSAKMVRLISKSSFNPYRIQKHILFDEKERSIIRLICEEKTNKEIADILFMSHRTVEGVRLKILEKMNVKNAAGIAIFAIKNFLYKIE